MIRTRPFRMLLLSRCPELHFSLLESFQRRGATVRIATRPARAMAQLRQGSDMVLVDLAHGARLSPAVVRELNSGRESRLVVGLHEGTLEHLPEHASELMPSAYLDGRDLAGNGGLAFGAAVPGSTLVH